MKSSISLQLSQKEAALLFLIRRIGFGTIEKVGINRSQPSVVFLGAQRLDLEKDTELKAVLDATTGPAVDLTPTGEVSKVQTPPPMKFESSADNTELISEDGLTVLSRGPCGEPHQSFLSLFRQKEKGKELLLKVRLEQVGDLEGTESLDLLSALLGLQ